MEVDLTLDRRAAAASLATLGIAAIAGQANAQSSTGPSGVGTLVYDPVPIRRARKTKIVKSGAEVEVFWDELNETQKRDRLPNFSQWTAIYELNASGSGEAKLLPGKVSGSKGVYRAIIDFVRYGIEDIVEGGGFVGRGVYGVGLRTVVDIQTKKANLELNSLVPIAVQAKMEAASGTLRYDSIGISHSGITELVPTNLPLDESGVTAALTATAAIRMLLKDDSTKLTPHLLAVERPTSTNTQKLINTLQSTARVE